MRSFSNALEVLREAYVNRHEPEYLRILTNIYWHAVLSITAFIVALSVCYGLWQLISIIGGSKENPSALSPDKVTPSPLDRAALENTVKSFMERRTQYEFLKANPPTVSDPSR